MEQDTAEQDGAAQSVANVPPLAERTGPFYFRTADDKCGRVNKPQKMQEMLDKGCAEITREEYQLMKNAEKDKAAPPVSPPLSDSAEEVLQPDAGRAASVEPAPQPEAPAALLPVKQEVAAEPEFVRIATELEKDVTATDNMSIWRQVMRTNPRFTKQLSGTGFDGTSINAEYMFMRATETFGPIGAGWGFEILEDRMLPGAPMSEAIYENNKFVCKRILRDADGSLITSLNHSIKIRFWYLIEGDIRGEIEAYGATPYMYNSKNGITCDGEAQKKSLTDAIKKALSLLGFSADIWLGLYDLPQYKQEIAIEFGIKDASDDAEQSTRIREELDEKFKNNVETMRSAVTANEVSKIAQSLTRTIGTHLKSARDINDTDYAKYLEGRLRRLEEVKSECISKLTETQE